jgi:hypothetical protein
MARSRRERLSERARGRCEYCAMPETHDALPFQLDHIRSRKHAGASTLANLAFTCLACNSYKGSNIAGIDPDTQTLQPLFNPRSDYWGDHFEWDGATLLGKTPIGRTTISVLRINLADRVEHRRLLMEAGVF